MNTQNTRFPIYHSREIRNFIYPHSLPETMEMLYKIIDHFIDGLGTAIRSDSEKERILDFLESLEELLPSLYNETDENTWIDNKRLN